MCNENLESHSKTKDFTVAGTGKELKEIAIEGEIQKETRFEELLTCPICEKKEMKHTVIEMDIPYFGRCLNTNFFCSCGYKNNDMFVVNMGSPEKLVVEINSSDDMNIRIAKSDSATVIIPELGLKVEPSSSSTAFITNVEGILEKFLYAIRVGMNGASPDIIEHGEKLISDISSVKDGGLKVTLIFIDPYGNSMIDSVKTVKSEIPDDELENLSTGRTVYEKNA